jgi:xanthine/CO dehydrogenase XdhC/CoxF family maturation factor
MCRRGNATGKRTTDKQRTHDAQTVSLILALRFPFESRVRLWWYRQQVLVAGNSLLIHIQQVTTHRSIVNGLNQSAAAGESVVLATVVRVTGSGYGGVGARMLVRGDGSTVGVVSGGYIESDLAAPARQVHDSGRAKLVSYDTRNDDDAPWGLGLGCNGLIEVLLEPLPPARAAYLAKLLDRALAADKPSVLATVIKTRGEGDESSLGVGAHALIIGNRIEKTGGWGTDNTLAKATADTAEVLAAGRRGLVRNLGGVEVAYEVVTPAVQLVICGSGPDVVPLARFASELGWNATIVDHRPVSDSRAERYHSARAVECAEAAKLGEAVTLTPRTAAVVMSHNLARDTDYVQALLDAGVAYVGVLGPRARTERMLLDLESRASEPLKNSDRVFAPVGMDIGGDGPDAIALAVIAEISAVINGRKGGHLRDKKGALHSPMATD